MSFRLSLCIIAASIVSFASCKTETTNSTNTEQVSVEKKQNITPARAANTVDTSADGHLEASLQGKLGKLDDGSAYIQIDDATKIRLDLTTNSIATPNAETDVNASGYFLESENGEVFVVEQLSALDGAQLSLAGSPAPRPTAKPKPPVKKSYWRCVGTVVYPLQCVLYRSGADGGTKTDATNKALTACRTICPQSKNAQCVVPPNSRLFPTGSTVAKFSDSMGGCAYYDAAKNRWRR